MIEKTTIRPSIALSIYLLLAFFPGCLCAHFLRLAAISNILFNVILGIGLLVSPFALLSLLLILFINKGLNRSTTIIYKRRRFHLFLGLSLLVIALLIFVIFVENTFELYNIFSDEARLQATYSGNAAPFGLQFITSWIGSYIFGLAILLLGLFLSLRRKDDRIA